LLRAKQTLPKHLAGHTNTYPDGNPYYHEKRDTTTQGTGKKSQSVASPKA